MLNLKTFSRRKLTHLKTKIISLKKKNQNNYRLKQANSFTLTFTRAHNHTFARALFPFPRHLSLYTHTFLFFTHSSLLLSQIQIKIKTKIIQTNPNFFNFTHFNGSCNFIHGSKIRFLPTKSTFLRTRSRRINWQKQDHWCFNSWKRRRFETLY